MINVTKLLQNLWGDQLRNKIERLEDAYAVASAPFSAEAARVDRIAGEFQTKVDAGTAAWEETDDDGYHYDYGEVLLERREDAQNALMTLRKAFAALFYHQWERSMQRWAKPGTAPDHADLVKAGRRESIPLDEDGLELMRLLANTLKHNSAKWGKQLYDKRPDLFSAGFDPAADDPVTGKLRNRIDWADWVVLTDANLREFAAVVRNSTPK